MKTFIKMNSLRYERITKNRSKDTRGTSTNFQRMVRGGLTYLYFLTTSLSTINEA